MIKKLFCRHEWKIHAKKQYQVREMRIVQGTAHWWQPMVEELTVAQYVEVLNCEKCGKIRVLKY